MGERMWSSHAINLYYAVESVPDTQPQWFLRVKNWPKGYTPVGKNKNGREKSEN